MRIILPLIIAIACSCASDSKQSQIQDETQATSQSASQTRQNNNAQEAVDAFSNGKPTVTSAKRVGKVETNFNKHGIPDACDLLTQKTIGKWIGIPAASISLADGSSSRHDKQRACFFKWDVGNIPNAGVMVQVQQNQVADDVPEYLSYMITSLKTDGLPKLASMFGELAMIGHL